MVPGRQILESHPVPLDFLPSTCPLTRPPPHHLKRSLLHETGCSGLVHWDDPEGWDGEGLERGVQDPEHMYIHG